VTIQTGWVISDNVQDRRVEGTVALIERIPYRRDGTKFDPTEGRPIGLLWHCTFPNHNPTGWLRAKSPLTRNTRFINQKLPKDPSSRPQAEGAPPLPNRNSHIPAHNPRKLIKYWGDSTRVRSREFPRQQNMGNWMSFSWFPNALLSNASEDGDAQLTDL
jgi:hypothetical protein